MLKWPLILAAFLYSAIIIGQNCYLTQEFASSTLLSKRKVKELKIIQGDPPGTLLYHFFFLPNGCVQREVFHDMFSKGVAPVVTSYTESLNGTFRAVTKVRVSQEASVLMEKREEWFSKSGKMLKRIMTQGGEISVVTTDRYDTSGLTRTDNRILRIHVGSGDTLSEVTNVYDGTQKLFLLKVKQGGVWKESEKLITLYSNESFFEEKYWKDGQLVRTLTKEQLEAQKNANQNLEILNNNPLPFGTQVVTDTSYTQILPLQSVQKGEPNKKLKYRLVRYSTEYDPKVTDHLDVIEQSSGLLKKRLYPNSAHNLNFEYILKP